MATVAAQPRRRGGPARVIGSPLFARVLFPVVVVGGWTLLYFSLPSEIFPSPAEVLSFMWDELTLDTLARENVYQVFLLSLARLFTGFLIAIVIGTVIGLAMGLSKSADAFFHDWVMAILAMPALVWALFAGLVLGFGSTGPVIVTAVTGIPYVIVNIREGVRNTPRELFDMAASFRVPRNRMTRHLLLPALMPFFFAAVRYGFSIGWKGLVIAEVFASESGAGWMIKYWYDARRPYAVVGYALFFIAFALALEKLVFDRIYERTFRWRPAAGQVEIVEAELGPDLGTDIADEVASGTDSEHEVRTQDG
jgi:ABC-type nitrate/sulfonate/bicarbonate transport system permease component